MIILCHFIHWTWGRPLCESFSGTNLRVSSTPGCWSPSPHLSCDTDNPNLGGPWRRLFAYNYEVAPQGACKPFTR
jgi:hypothetical protein